MFKFEEIIFENHKCLRLFNDTVEVVVTIDMGPRVLKYNKLGKENVFDTTAHRTDCFEGEDFDKYYWKGACHRLVGGHRMWITPEHSPETYYPDNDPVEYKITQSGAEFICQPQKKNNIQMKMELEFMGGAQIKVHHKVKNLADTVRECSIWCISMMSLDGTGIIRQNLNNTDKLPNRTISLWSYTKANDPRFYLGKDYISVKADTQNQDAFKFGTGNRDGVFLCCTKDQVFVNRCDTYFDTDTYPDGGCSFECYTSNVTLELEVLDRILSIAPNEENDFINVWDIVDNPSTPQFNDEAQLNQFWNKIL